MSDFVFNIAKGKIAQYAALTGTSDALVFVLLKSTGLESDATLKDYDTLATLLAGASNEADASGYARQTLTAATVTVNDTDDRVDIDVADVTFAAVAAGNTIGKLLVCYDPDTGAGDDTTVVPLAAYDYTATTDGSDLVVQVDAAGLMSAA